MIIKSVRVQNFRSIRDETLVCEPLTALVGPNGAGKSSFLRALEVFFSPTPRFGQEEFYAEDVNQDIEVTITFTGLGREENERFASYIEGNDLTVVRVLSLAGGKLSAKYHGSRLQNPDFVQVRTAGGAREVIARYNQLRQDARYAALPAARAQDAALQAMMEWELAHPEQCTRQRDDGQFFGFTEVGQGYLGRYARFIPIPAVRDAAEDAAEGRGTPITQIIDLVVRSVLANREDLKKLREDAARQYDEIMDPANLTELTTLAGQLTGTLKTYVPDASVSLFWVSAGGIEIPMPKADVKLVEDGYASGVVRTGHGLQRAFILTMLQHLAVARAPTEPRPAVEGANQQGDRQLPEPEPTMTDLILGIEEPELYQHPSRQRHLARILLALASGAVPGVARRTQVIYGTHSPLFVGLDRFEQVRLLRKVAGPDGKPKVTKAVWATLDQVAEALWEATGRPAQKFTGETLRPRLQAIMTPWMSEGFFADVAVLVEGEGDRAAIVGIATAMGHDLESVGISVIPCMGKTNLDRPAVIFQRLGISVYLIWDSDEGGKEAKPADNQILLRLLGEPEEDWPARVTRHFACFRNNLETTLREELGAHTFDTILQRVQGELGIPKRDQALKNPQVIQAVIKGVRAEGKSSPTMEAIVTNILALKQGAGRA
jgi:hypothetical protein